MTSSSSTRAHDAGSGSMSSHRYPWKWWLRDLEEPTEDAPTVFSTFACGGGSSMGYKRAGYKVLGNCEIDPRVAAIYKRNLHPKLSYVMDIRDFNALDNLPDELHNLDVLDGSPPCSTFSMAGSREDAWGVEKQFAEGQKLQRLDDLFFVYLETVRKLMPKVFVAENVTGLLKGNARGYVNEIVKTARGLGYEVQLFKLNAAFMGVPQKRERVFFVGNRMGYQKLELSFNEEAIPFGAVRTRDGGASLSPSISRLAEKMRLGDMSVCDAYKRENGKRGFFNYNYNYDGAVAFTATARHRNIRVCDMTFMTDDDLRNVGTFPQDYDFGDKGPEFITGMSVPPSMMANIAHEIRTQWLDKE